MRKKLSVIKLIVLLNFLTVFAFAQAPAQSSINTLISKIGAYNNAMPVEKSFLQFDKPYYSIGDTVWFKGYLTNEALSYSALSCRLYVELLNDSNAVVKRFVFPAGYGVTWGAIPLSNNYVHEGTYTIRAYTNWMRNFGDDYFFKQSFYINNQGDNTWLVNMRPSISLVDGKDNVKLALKFTSMDDKASAGLRDLQLKVLNGKKVLLRSAAQTEADGTMNIDFNLPPQTALKNLNIVAQDKQDKTRSVLIPVEVNRPQDVDIQFMPESGPMVESIPSRVGFKAIGEDGKGVEIHGTLFDSDHNEMGEINSLYNGMGTLDITPQPGKTYTAEITLPGGAKKTLQLPAAQKTGTVLKVKNNMDRDTIMVAMYNTTQQTDGKYYLIGMARGVVCYAGSFVFNNNYFAVRVAKSLFPTGVAHFILLNQAQQPVNERVTFINHDDNLKIELKPGAKTYNPRDSIPVHINVKDADGKPIVGSFSMAVTDDNQVKTENATADNIVSHMLLTSELKGYVENPMYYLRHDEQAWRALDALLLTQGWVGYDLKKIDQPVKINFDPEIEFAVKGTVTNLFNRPVSKSDVMLLSKGTPNFFKDTVTNDQGKFVFNRFPAIKDATFIISARNKNGKVINGGVSVDEKNQTPANVGTTTLLNPWNVNTDTTLLNYVKLNKSYHDILDKQMYGVSGRVLRSVNVHDRVGIKGSQNLNDPASTDQVLNEDVMVNAGKASLLDVIASKVSGFRTGFYKDSSKQSNLEYFIKDKRVRFVFDGVDLDRFYEPFGGQANEHYEYQKQYLDYIAAADILGVEVIYSQNARYNAQNLTNTDDLLAATPIGPMGSDYAYLEITTRAGNGPFIRRATGIYLYKPLPLAEYKEFYRPRYPVKNANPNADLRSTIHWAPNIVTDKEGNAIVSFYAADKPTNYTIILQGTDLSGKVGYQTQKVTIAGNTQ